MPRPPQVLKDKLGVPFQRGDWVVYDDVMYLLLSPVPHRSKAVEVNAGGRYYGHDGIRISILKNLPNGYIFPESGVPEDMQRAAKEILATI